MNRTCAGVKALMEIKDVTAEDARAIRYAWKTRLASRFEARDEVDRILRTCGVEFLGFDKRSGRSVYYCNAGDTYATTVIFHGPRMTVGCWGDLVERNRVREANF